MKNKLLSPSEAEDHADYGKKQAFAQIKSIIGMVKDLDTEDDDEREAAEQRIQEDPLSVQIRNAWHSPGDNNHQPSEFCILLCWGGPACQIVGDLDVYQEPESPRLQYQDWGTSWTDYPLTEEEEAALLAYCQQFYFSE